MKPVHCEPEGGSRASVSSLKSLVVNAATSPMTTEWMPVASHLIHRERGVADAADMNNPVRYEVITTWEPTAEERAVIAAGGNVQVFTYHVPPAIRVGVKP